MANIITIDGVEYVPKAQGAEHEGRKYQIVRSNGAGVFAGWRDENSPEGHIVLLNARRLWFWSGAASLSQLAMEGVSKPKECKFPVEVTRVEIMSAVEILDCTEQARKSIAQVKPWTA